MKILQIHKYYSKKRGGGSVSAFFETKKILEKNGHKIIIFSMQDKDNEISKYSEYFAEHFDIREVKNIFRKLWLIPRVIYNRDAVNRLNKLLTKEKPDVAHVHNIYHYLTPGILSVLKKNGVPIVFKLSDYHVICPNYKLFAHGKIDNSCKNGKYYKLLFNKSINNSYSESFVAMIEGYINKWCKFYNNVDIFLAPSQFMRDLVIRYGIPKEKIKMLRNVLNFDIYTGDYKKRKIFLYMGRISDEKGLDIAVDAMVILKNKKILNDWKFVIAGAGPYEEFLRQHIKNNKVEDVVDFVGFCKKGSEKWLQLMKNSAVAVLPSIWYDNSPIAISESMAFGSPAIVSDLGGTKEMIEDGKSGFVFKAGDVQNLANTMQRFIKDGKLVQLMGKEAREYIHNLNNEEKYYQQLMKIYKIVIDRSKKIYEK